MKILKVDAGRLVRKHIVMNVKLTGMRRFRLRFAITLWLLKLAALVSGINIRVSTDE